jgi:AcrR family transcriptional regulator
MSGNLDNVKTIRGKEGRYHHGALREALIKAAEEIIAERGISEFSLREAARRAGVTPSAPAHHFKDARGLLTAEAAAAYERLGVALEEAERALKGQDAPVRVKGTAAAYLAFALKERAKFSLMWRIDLIDRAAPDYSAAVRKATGVLLRSQREIVATTSPILPPTDVKARVAQLKNPALEPAVAAWTLVHGFSTLAVDGVFGEEGDGTGRGPQEVLTALLERLLI